MKNKKYIILEIIPTKIKDGDIVQLSALKLNELKLVDRFDYRLSESKLENPYIKEMINYDKDSFKYKDTTEEIINDFKIWIEDYDLLIIDNLYTKNYLGEIHNNIESILTYLNLDYSDYVIDKIVDKYKLEKSNYIVDLLYESLIFESNNK